MINFNFNKTFREVFTTKARYIDIWGGRGRGGSHFATDYFLFLLTQPKYFRGYLMREIYGDIRGSLFRDLKDRISENDYLDEDWFEINDSSMSVNFPITNNTITSKGFKKSSGKQTAKLKSIAGATHIIIEEYEEISKDEFEQLDDSLRTTKTDNIQIIRLFNPPDPTHYIIKEYYNLEPTQYEGYYKPIPKGIDGHLSIHSNYLNNYKNLNKTTLEKIERYAQFDKIQNEQEREMVKYHYLVDYLGLVPHIKNDIIFPYWELFDEAPKDYDYLVYGLDFGYSVDPTGIVECIVDGKNLYITEKCYETNLNNDDIANKLKQFIKQDSYVVCDSAEPKSINELRRLDIPAINAQKGQGSINYGIDKLKTFKIHIHKNSLNLQTEFKNYKFKKDIDGTNTNIPIDKFNHLIDAIRYAITKFI